MCVCVCIAQSLHICMDRCIEEKWLENGRGVGGWVIRQMDGWMVKSIETQMNACRIDGYRLNGNRCIELDR